MTQPRHCRMRLPSGALGPRRRDLACSLFSVVLLALVAVGANGSDVIRNGTAGSRPHIVVILLDDAGMSVET